MGTPTSVLATPTHAGHPQAPLRQRPSLSDLLLSAAQQHQRLSVIRVLPLDFGDR